MTDTKGRYKTKNFGDVYIDIVDLTLCFLGFEAPDTTYEKQNVKHYLVKDISAVIDDNKERDIKLVLDGTKFQNKVWLALLDIPKGQTISYQQLAKKIGHPKSHRAVTNAVGANPIAVIIPCHRVIQSNGKLGGYRYGQTMKRELLKREGVKIDE